MCSDKTVHIILFILAKRSCRLCGLALVAWGAQIELVHFLCLAVLSFEKGKLKAIGKHPKKNVEYVTTKQPHCQMTTNSSDSQRNSAFVRLSSSELADSDSSSHSSPHSTPSPGTLRRFACLTANERTFSGRTVV